MQTTKSLSSPLTQIQTIDSTMCFNLMQDSGISKMIFDLQDAKDLYGECHLRASTYVEYNPSSTESVEIEDDISKQIDIIFQNEKLKKRNLYFKKCVLYGNKKRVFQLAQLLLMEQKLHTIYIFLEPFSEFQTKYPFMCTWKDTRASETLFASEIIPNFLYLGSANNANNESEILHLRIDHIVNMAEEVECHDRIKEHIPTENYLKLGIGDTIYDNIFPLLEESLSFIDKVKEKNGKVLVHCNMGISRSSTIVIAYLMKYYKLKYEDCYAWVRQWRSFANPNRAFVQQLKNFENMCLQRSFTFTDKAVVKNEKVTSESITSVKVLSVQDSDGKSHERMELVTETKTTDIVDYA